MRGKNQNWLDEPNIDRIVNGFRDRVETPRFSHLATREEIAENDYNLNIPRYVDTYQAEPPVDMTTVTRNLLALDQGMAQIDESIRTVCAELGLEAPV